MLYLDTCVLVPLFVMEPGSAAVNARLLGVMPGETAISRWCATEFSSALSLKARRGDLQPVQHRQAIESFRNFTAHHLLLLDVMAEDFAQAAYHCEKWQTGLRSGDALHLAVAARHGATILCLDEKRVQAAKELGLSAELAK